MLCWQMWQTEASNNYINLSLCYVDRCGKLSLVTIMAVCRYSVMIDMTNWVQWQLYQSFIMPCWLVRQTEPNISLSLNYVDWCGKLSLATVMMLIECGHDECISVNPNSQWIWIGRQVNALGHLWLVNHFAPYYKQIPVNPIVMGK